MTDIKPCPFCGATLSRKYREEGGWEVAVKMRCDNDACPVKPEGKWYSLKDSPHHKNKGEWESREVTEAKALEAWNRRATSPAVRALVEACRAIKHYENTGAPDYMDWESYYDAIQEARAAVEREIEGE